MKRTLSRGYLKGRGQPLESADPVRYPWPAGIGLLQAGGVSHWALG